MENLRWFCARTKPRQERIAVRHLSQQNFETYCPQVKIERISKGRITLALEPVFPGYVLVRFLFADPAWRAINSTRGVTSLLTFGQENRPLPLPDDEVISLQSRENKGQLFISEIKRIRRGDHVKLKIGPAVDQIGKVIFTKGERVELLLYLLGRQTRVKAAQHLVEVVNQHTIG